MSSAPRKGKKKKQAKPEPVKKKEPEIVTCKLADNDYTGIIREGALGSQYLDCTNAKYTWHSGIKYEGPFVLSQIEGKGKFEWQDGSSYVGDLHGGKRHGAGSYVSNDGTTRYDGQWCMGKRHGEGKLTYNGDGSSFYEGSWKAGKKYGEGKQVWPSGNTYTGQWEDGQMQGQGTMTWFNQGQVETYTGHWEASQPHGEGTHTWLAPAPQPNQSFKDTTAQQLNNRYKGQWNKGTRHGKGTFYYANGAYYSGEWQDHVKQGRGRHVFEDGRIYDGPFENDSMTEFKAPEPVGLNFGNDDNPVRRMIDISDIQMFACPYDNRGLEAHPSHLLYLEPSRILREVYNMMLRSLGDLKELYYRYRVILPVQGEDPFVLSSHQFWLFARDCGLITPTCMVHRLDRHVWWGPRHHIENAPEDAEELRPLTPRPIEDKARLGHRKSAATGLAEGLEDLEDPEEGDEASEESLSSSGAGSPMGREAESQGAARRSAAPLADRRPSGLTLDAVVPPAETPIGVSGSDIKEDAANGPLRPKADSDVTKLLSEHHSGPPRIHRYRRDEAHVSNIHNPTGHLLFRQFVESFVRIALARFPCEKSLDIQCARLLKEKILPHLETLRKELKEGERQTLESSQRAFDYVADQDFRKVVDEFRPTLTRAFRGLPVVAADVEDPHHLQAERHQGRDAESGNIVRIRHYGDFGAPIHNYHVCARLDKTIRVKDVLRLFNACGFLRGLTRGEIPWADLAKQIFGYAGNEDLLDIDEREKEELIAAQESGSTTPSESDGLGSRTLTGLQSTSGGMGGFGGFGAQSGGMAGFGGLGSSMDETEEKRSKSSKLGESRSRRRGKKDAEDDEKASKDKDEHHESDAANKASAVATLPDFSTCDFRITPLQALRVILEVASPGSAKALYWHLEGGQITATNEMISLLEFAESEMIFQEFVRLLIRMSDLGTRKDIPLCERLSPAARFEGFVRHIFFPAMRTPYVPPGPVDEVEKGSDAARSNGSARDAPASAREAEAPVGEEDVAAEEELVVDEVKDDDMEIVAMWAGFDDYSCAEAEALTAGRRWPEGYQDEVASWV